LAKKIAEVFVDVLAAACWPEPICSVDRLDLEKAPQCLTKIDRQDRVSINGAPVPHSPTDINGHIIANALTELLSEEPAYFISYLFK
jgi:hypothetical protein